jgi:hypothetical protein
MLRTLLQRHSELKARIHAFRMPVRSRAGLNALRCFYVGVPLLLGYLTMQATNSIAKSNLGERGELLLAAKAKWGPEEVPRWRKGSKGAAVGAGAGAGAEQQQGQGQGQGQGQQQSMPPASS